MKKYTTTEATDITLAVREDGNYAIILHDDKNSMYYKLTKDDLKRLLNGAYGARKGELNA